MPASHTSLEESGSENLSVNRGHRETKSVQSWNGVPTKTDWFWMLWQFNPSQAPHIKLKSYLAKCIKSKQFTKREDKSDLNSIIDTRLSRCFGLCQPYTFWVTTQITESSPSACVTAHFKVTVHQASTFKKVNDKKAAHKKKPKVTGCPLVKYLKPLYVAQITQPSKKCSTHSPKSEAACSTDHKRPFSKMLLVSICG